MTVHKTLKVAYVTNDKGPDSNADHTFYYIKPLTEIPAVEFDIHVIDPEVDQKAFMFVDWFFHLNAKVKYDPYLKFAKKLFETELPTWEQRFLAKTKMLTVGSMTRRSGNDMADALAYTFGDDYKGFTTGRMSSSKDQVQNFPRKFGRKTFLDEVNELPKVNIINNMKEFEELYGPGLSGLRADHIIIDDPLGCDPGMEAGMSKVFEDTKILVSDFDHELDARREELAKIFRTPKHLLFGDVHAPAKSGASEMMRSVLGFDGKTDGPGFNNRKKIYNSCPGCRGRLINNAVGERCGSDEECGWFKYEIKDSIISQLFYGKPDEELEMRNLRQKFFGIPDDKLDMDYKQDRLERERRRNEIAALSSNKVEEKPLRIFDYGEVEAKVMAFYDVGVDTGIQAAKSDYLSDLVEKLKVKNRSTNIHEGLNMKEYKFLNMAEKELRRRNYI